MNENAVFQVMGRVCSFARLRLCVKPAQPAIGSYLTLGSEWGLYINHSTFVLVNNSSEHFAHSRLLYPFHPRKPRLATLLKRRPNHARVAMVVGSRRLMMRMSV
jgi:hypothetical protein